MKYNTLWKIGLVALTVASIVLVVVILHLDEGTAVDSSIQDPTWIKPAGNFAGLFMLGGVCALIAGTPGYISSSKRQCKKPSKDESVETE